jgi:hypothetical protein
MLLRSIRSSNQTTSEAREPNLWITRERTLGDKGLECWELSTHWSRDLTNDFCDIIHQYEISLSTQIPGTRINVRGTHSWDEVIRAAKDAEAAYHAEAKKGAKGAVRGYLRRFGDYSAAITPWIGLLPSDQYFSVLCGGLKLVFGVCAKRSRMLLVLT